MSKTHHRRWQLGLMIAVLLASLLGSVQARTNLATEDARVSPTAARRPTVYIFTEKGANQIARLVSEGVREINVPISRFKK